MTVAVDGRTDVEKLYELLLEPEQTHLDFKANIDLSDNKGRLNFVKDAVAMMNRLFVFEGVVGGACRLV